MASLSCVIARVVLDAQVAQMTVHMFDRHEGEVYQSLEEENCWPEGPQQWFRSSWYLMLLNGLVSDSANELQSGFPISVVHTYRFRYLLRALPSAKLPGPFL